LIFKTPPAGQKPFEGSNPSLSAIRDGKIDRFLQLRLVRRSVRG
jgi:hypothetical protein